MATRNPPQLQLRVRFDATHAFGPGKADLLERIAATGSISAAARAMRMSYKRAWELVDDVNRAFRDPLVEKAAGGAQGGGAALTRSGRRVLAAYRELQQAAALAAQPQLAVLGRLRRTAKNGSAGAL